MRVRSLAVPVEHGAWGFLVEPIVLGLLAAPSPAGALISAGAVFVFLLRQPLRVLMTETGRFSASARRRWALRIAAVYGAAAATALAAGFSIAGPAPFAALLLGAPLVLAFFLYDSRKRSRRTLPELAGPLGLAGSAPAVVLAGGMAAAESFAVWMVVAARVIPSVLYVRTRLRLLRGEGASRAGVVGWHAGFLCLGIWLGRAGLAPYTAGVAIALLLARAIWGMWGRPRATRAAQIGVQEIVYGLLYALIAASGYWWGDSWGRGADG